MRRQRDTRCVRPELGECVLRRGKPPCSNARYILAAGVPVSGREAALCVVPDPRAERERAAALGRAVGNGAAWRQGRA